MNLATDAASLQALSALADGEASAAETAAATTAWRSDATARERWHAYHLIGDVLRSDELAGVGHDAAFLRALRARLEAEPVVLAPEAARPVDRPARVGAGTLCRWGTPAAVAAGFMAVAAALTVTHGPLPPAAAPAPQLAQAAPPQPAAAPALVGPVAVVDAATAPEREPAAGVLIRDARLDQYLMAHKQFGGSSALGVPSGFLRSATFENAGVAPGSR